MAPARSGQLDSPVTGRATPRLSSRSALLADFGPTAALVLLCLIFSVLGAPFAK